MCILEPIARSVLPQNFRGDDFKPGGLREPQFGAMSLLDRELTRLQTMMDKVEQTESKHRQVEE